MSRQPLPGESKRVSIDEVVRVAVTAGFRGDNLVTAVAVSCAENTSHDVWALGDVSLETTKWGPSVGLWQIRSLRADFGSGRVRDQVELTDPTFNARAAYSISSGGRNWQPWSTFTSGAYRTFLKDATDAVTRGGTSTGTIATAVAGGTSIAAASQGGSNVPLTVGGRKLTGELGEVVIGGRVDLSTSEVSEVTLTLLDDIHFTLTKRYRLGLDSVIHCLGLPFRIVSFGCGDHRAGVAVDLTAHPAGVVAMRLANPDGLSNISPTAYMERIARAAGLKFFGRPSGQRANVGPSQVKDSQGNDRPETAWEVGKRLADGLGYYAFEAAGTYYFAPADYIKSNAARVQLVSPGATPYPTGNVGKAYEALSVPRCRATMSANITDLQRRLGRTSIIACDVSVSTTVSRDLGEELRPAMNAWLPGAAPFFAKDGQLITRVSWDLADASSPVQVQAGTVAAKNGTELTSADTDVANDVPALFSGSGSKSALDFVTVVLRQVGDKYVWGAEASASDHDPSAFDCSELVEWGAAQTGVTFVDASYNQWAAIKKAGTTLTIAQAARTRGALLFLGSPVHHVAISLGDGRYTVEAKGRQYGVIAHDSDAVIAGRGWIGAGKIPGMVYP